MKQIKKFWGGVVHFFKKPGEFRKSYTVLALILSEAVTANVFHGTLGHELQVIEPVVAWIGVHFVKNDQLTA